MLTIIGWALIFGFGGFVEQMKIRWEWRQTGLSYDPNTNGDLVAGILGVEEPFSRRVSAFIRFMVYVGEIFAFCGESITYSWGSHEMLAELDAESPLFSGEPAEDNKNSNNEERKKK